MANSFVGIYKSIADAEDAVRSLCDEGYPVDNVSIIARRMEDHHRLHAYVTLSDAATAAGSFLGGIFGLLRGVAFVWAPGLGPLIVAGSIVALVLAYAEGVVAGALAGGLLGWLVKLAISEEKIQHYEQLLQAGKVLVVVYGPDEYVPKAKEILGKTRFEQLDLHAPVTA